MELAHTLNRAIAKGTEFVFLSGCSWHSTRREVPFLAEGFFV